jgi:hypothetical protein
MRLLQLRSRSRTARASIGLVFALAVASRAPAATVQRTHLVTLPKEAEPHSISLSDDGSDTVYIVASPDGRRVEHAGRQGPPYAEIAPPRMAPGTKRVFYWALDASTGKRVVYLVADSTPTPAAIARTGKFFFSPVGAHWAAVGGTEIQTGANEFEAGPVRLWVDGEVVDSYKDMSFPTFSPDGAHLAYLIQDDAGQVKLLVDGRELRAFEPPETPVSAPLQADTVGPNLPPRYQSKYLSDGSLLTVATDRDGWAIFRGRTRLASYPRTIANSQGDTVFGSVGERDQAAAFVPSSLAAAEAAPRAVWWERLPDLAERWRVVRDGQPFDGLVCPRYWDLEAPVISADGRHVAYACHTAAEGQPDDEVYVFHDGTRYGPYANVWGIALSPDGRRIAYAADSGAADTPWFYVVDGRRGRPLFDKVFPPRFSPDGAHVTWVGKRNHRFLAFLDRHGVASSDDLIWPPTFKLGKGLSWAVIRGRRVSRLDVAY